MKKNSPSFLLNNEIIKIQEAFAKIRTTELKNFNKLCLLSLQQIKKGNKIIFLGTAAAPQMPSILQQK